MPVSDKVKLAAREQFPNATDDEIEQHYGEIKNQLAAQGDTDVTDDEIIQTFRAVAPELKNSMSTGPVMGDVERAEKRYADELAKLKMGRRGDMSLARAADVWANWRGQTDPRQKALLDRYSAEEEQLKDLTLGAAGRRTAARKEDMDLKSSELGLATKQQQYDITKDEQERAARLRDPNSDESNRLRERLKPLVTDYGFTPEQLDGLNVQEMKDMLNLSQETVDLAIKKSQEERLTSAEERAARVAGRVEKTQAQLSDPNSPVSQLVRAGLAENGLKVDPNLTAQQAKEMGFDVDKLLTYRKERLKAQQDKGKPTEAEKTIQREESKAAVKLVQEIPVELSAMENKLKSINKMLELAPDVEAGKIEGKIGTLQKYTFGGAEEEEFDKLAAESELTSAADYLRGQGTITDSERDILRAALPTRDLDNPQLVSELKRRQEIIEKGLAKLRARLAEAQEIVKKGGGSLGTTPLPASDNNTETLTQGDDGVWRF